LVRRDVSARLELDVIDPARLYLQVAPPVSGFGSVADRRLSEELDVRLGETHVPVREIEAAHLGRVHVVELDPGRVVIDYAASITGRDDRPIVDEIDLFRYVRPSRYVESDRLTSFAFAEFAGLEEDELLAGVSSWVGSRLGYVAGSSRSTDGAVSTLLAGEGVCRDFAHLTIALLRAMDMPARVVSVYAPGLAPMDFHAVTEAYVQGAWQVVDATLLAPRSSMIRIATGRDCADTAFLSTYGGTVELLDSQVTATVDGQLPGDDPRTLAVLG
jgi:transglutaminase-like putative cysteine protease